MACPILSNFYCNPYSTNPVGCALKTSPPSDFYPWQALTVESCNDLFVGKTYEALSALSSLTKLELVRLRKSILSHPTTFLRCSSLRPTFLAIPSCPLVHLVLVLVAEACITLEGYIMRMQETQPLIRNSNKK